MFYSMACLLRQKRIRTSHPRTFAITPAPLELAALLSLNAEKRQGVSKIISCGEGEFFNPFVSLYTDIFSSFSFYKNTVSRWWLVWDKGGEKFIRFGINFVSSRHGKGSAEGGVLQSSIPSCPLPCYPEMEERKSQYLSCAMCQIRVELLSDLMIFSDSSVLVQCLIWVNLSLSP